MIVPIENSGDLLNIVFAVTTGVVGLLLAILLVYLINIVRRVNTVVALIERTIDKVDSYITKPIAAISEIVDQARPVVEFIASFRKRRRDRED